MGKEITEYRVALLCGGSSGEREISLKSGEAAAQALESAGFAVEVFDPSDRSALVHLIEESFDVAFLCLHGRGGEDGAIQGFLETIGMPYTGSGIEASALALDKLKTKQIYREANIPTPQSLHLNARKPFNLATIMQEATEKMVIKPATEGSSLGVTIAQGSSKVQAAIKMAFSYDDSVLVERFVGGIEVTASVLGNEDPIALPLIQMIPQNEFYDFESKYETGGSEHLCPAPLSKKLTLEVQQLACRAHEALGCRGVSRTDFIIDAQNKVWALETNTIPGMTATSLLPEAARAAGISFSALCTKLIEFALE